MVLYDDFRDNGEICTFTTDNGVSFSPTLKLIGMIA